MAASTITRDTWTNDTGSAAAPNADGTVLNNNALQNNVYARIDAMFAGAGAYATFTLGGKLAVEGFGTHSFSAGGTGANALFVTNTTSGTGNYALLRATAGTTVANLAAFSQGYTTGSSDVQAGASLVCTGAGGLSISAENAAGVIRFYTGASVLRWGINAAGDKTFGASSHIADSAGTPVITSGFGAGPTITGTDYGFVIAIGTGTSTGGLVTFGHAFTNAPICVASTTSTSLDNMTLLSSTSTLTIGYDSAALAGVGIYVLCRGY
jgi:hypothetical protein